MVFWVPSAETCGVSLSPASLEPMLGNTIPTKKVVFMYICLCIYIYTRTYTRIHTYMYYVHIYICVCINLEYIHMNRDIDVQSCQREGKGSFALVWLIAERPKADLPLNIGFQNEGSCFLGSILAAPRVLELSR